MDAGRAAGEGDELGVGGHGGAFGSRLFITSVVSVPVDRQTLSAIADLICGDDAARHPVRRSGSELTRFFERAGLPRFRHDGSTRKWWTLEAVSACSEAELEGVIKRLAHPKEYTGDGAQADQALGELNRVLIVEGLKVERSGIEPTIRKVVPDVAAPPKKEPELKPLPPPDFLALGLEPGVGELLAERWREAQRCLDAKAYLAGTIMMGSLLEGLLLGVALCFPKEANQASAAPRDTTTSKVRQFHAWTLSEMIDVAHALGWIDLDVSRFSHALRDFRNLIHPYQQLASKTAPDEDTCKISWLVVQAAVNDLARVLKPRP